MSDWVHSQSRRSLGVNGTASTENKATQDDFFLLKLVNTYSLHFSQDHQALTQSSESGYQKKSYTNVGEGFVFTTFQGELWKPSGSENVSDTRGLLSQIHRGIIGTVRKTYLDNQLDWTILELVRFRRKNEFQDVAMLICFRKAHGSTNTIRKYQKFGSQVVC